MRLYSILFAVIFTLSGCDFLSMNIHDLHYLSKLRGVKLYYSEDFSHIATRGEIITYLQNRVQYVADEPGEDNWQSPQETLERGIGDCEDFALLYMNIAWFQLGTKAHLILVDDVNAEFYPGGRAIVGEGKINHAVVEIDGIIVEPQSKYYGYPQSNAVYKYTFDQVFR